MLTLTDQLTLDLVFPAPPPERLTCRHCGHTEANLYLFDIEHSLRYRGPDVDTCSAMDLVRRQAAAVARRFQRGKATPAELDRAMSTAADYWRDRIDVVRADVDAVLAGKAAA